MDGWKIRRAVDLQEDSPPVERLRALATLSSRQAHDFVIVVLDGDKPADLTGMQPWLSMILPGRASLQKQVGRVQANVVSVTLPKIGYAERGDVSIILSLMDKDGQTQIPLYGCVMRVMEDSTDTIIDEGNVIPSLAELLAQFDACKAAAGAANTAAGKAISAASAADVAAKAANTQARTAQNAATLAGRAATNAQNAADRIDGMTATAASLSADETPTANLVKAGDHYELELGIPQGRKGDTGATPKIKLSVVTGEPGTDARVEQSGTAENPMVEFTIPQGMKGDTGEKGEKGDPGRDAPQEVVLYTAQTLDDAQKAQARENIGAADAAAVNQLNEKANKSIVSDAWQSGKTYAVGTYCIYNDNLFKAAVQTSAKPGNGSDWVQCNVTNELVAQGDTLNNAYVKAYFSSKLDKARPVTYPVLPSGGYLVITYNYASAAVFLVRGEGSSGFVHRIAPASDRNLISCKWENAQLKLTSTDEASATVSIIRLY